MKSKHIITFFIRILYTYLGIIFYESITINKFTISSYGMGIIYSAGVIIYIILPILYIVYIISEFFNGKYDEWLNNNIDEKINKFLKCFKQN